MSSLKDIVNQINPAAMRVARTTHDGTHTRTAANTVKTFTAITAIVEAVRRRTGRLNLLFATII